MKLNASFRILSLILLCVQVLSFELAYGVSMEIIGKNEKLLFTYEEQVSLPITLGDLSLKVFDQQKVPYQGSVYGIVSIFGLGQEMEILSDYEMKAYGWCYSIDGQTPELMPDELIIADQDVYIRWFYAYAHYLSGDWIGQCQDAGDFTPY